MSSPFKQRPRRIKHRNNRWSRRSQCSFNIVQWVRRVALAAVASVLGLFLLTTLGSIIQAQVNGTSQSLNKWTSQISDEAFMTVVSMEIPAMNAYHAQSEAHTPLTSIMFEMITSLNPSDPRSLIRYEIPGFAFFDGDIISRGEGVGYADIPIESSPPLAVVLEEREAVMERLNGDPPQDPVGPKQSPEQHTDGREVVFIYHTHNRESWLPHLPEAQSPNEAFHPEINITKVGEHLGAELRRRGVGTYVDTTDFAQRLSDEGLPFSLSYAKSREVVQEVLGGQEDIKLVFDLHRDALARDRTTVEINGKDYARTFFVIGRRHENYQQNLQFAYDLNGMLDERYPGLSRGIYVKETGDAEYNQSLFDHNVLIEIGGVENTLDESYLTAEALADVIADFYFKNHHIETEPVSGS